MIYNLNLVSFLILAKSRITKTLQLNSTATVATQFYEDLRIQIGAGAVAIVIMLILLYYCCCRKKKDEDDDRDGDEDNDDEKEEIKTETGFKPKKKMMRFSSIFKKSKKGKEKKKKKNIKTTDLSSAIESAIESSAVESDMDLEVEKKRKKKQPNKKVWQKVKGKWKIVQPKNSIDESDAESYVGTPKKKWLYFNQSSNQSEKPAKQSQGKRSTNEKSVADEAAFEQKRTSQLTPGHLRAANAAAEGKVVGSNVKMIIKGKEILWLKPAIKIDNFCQPTRLSVRQMAIP